MEFLMERIKMRNIFVQLTLLIALPIAVFASTLFTQASNKLPQLTIAYYDCDCSAAITNSPSEKSILAMASYYMYQKIISDTASSPNLSFISYGFADSLIVGSVFSGESFTLPDTSRQPDNTPYIVTSKITGNPGNYVLTILVLDGYSYAHAIDKTAIFSSATDSDVKSASLSAVAQLLPLSNAILTYQQSLRNANPSLCINPKITVLPSDKNIPLKGNTEVSFTVIDCDGVPLANRHISLDAKHGTFNPESLVTDNSGQAQAMFTGGSKDAVDVLSATMVNVTTVTHDTISPHGAAPMIIGDPKTKFLAMLTFDYLFSKTTCQGKVQGDSWSQKTSFGAYQASGFMIGWINALGMSFGGSDDWGWCDIGAYYHNLEIYRERNKTSCPKMSWHMNGESYALLATGGEDGSYYGGELGLEADNPYYSGSKAIDIGFPPDSIDLYSSFYWGDDSEWDNMAGVCRSSTSTDRYSSHHNCAFGPGSTFWWMGDPVLYFNPIYSAGDSTKMIGFTAAVIDIKIRGTKDSSYEVTTLKFHATAMPISTYTAVDDKETILPIKFSLSQNYPNPFNPSTTIKFSVGTYCHTSLRVYDLLGREVATLVNEVKAPGSYTATFNTTNMSSGVYFYRLQAGNYTETKKLMLLK
jgi:hypothetical protein